MSSPIQQTIIFGVAFFVVLFLSMKRKKGDDIFPVETTDELKGLAMIAIILSHIGYFLVSDTRFLSPFSDFAGVGVDVFLFLSGFGLATSAIRKQLSVKEFYQKRLGKIFLPLWITLSLLLLADYFILHKTYPIGDTIINFFGIFRHADIYGDIDSPLWYITLTLFYYLLFPFLFLRKHPVLGAVFLYFAGYFVLQYILPPTLGVFPLYQLHFIAFPLGAAFSVFFQKYELVFSKYIQNIRFRIGLTALSCVLIVLLSTHSGVGKDHIIEQLMSIATMLCLFIIFILKKIQFRALSLIGIYSYEIYLLHWPLLYRYDFLYKYFPAGIVTLLYIFIFLVLGVCLHFIIQKLFFDKKTV